MIVTVPLGQSISRNEINMRMRATSNDKKIEKISKALRSMLVLGQIQKRMHMDSCQVVFWATQNATEKGEHIRGQQPDEEIINYLIDPPLPPPPAPPPAPPAPPPVVPPPEPETLLKSIQTLMKNRKSCTLHFLCSHFESRKDEVVDLVELLWSTQELCRDSKSNADTVHLWIPSHKSKWVNDPMPSDEAKIKTEDEDEDVEEPEFYMMRDLKSKNKRILLRPTGDTLKLTVDEIEFIQSLKKPYVTL